MAAGAEDGELRTGMDARRTEFQKMAAIGQQMTRRETRGKALVEMRRRVRHNEPERPGEDSPAASPRASWPGKPEAGCAVC